MGVCPWVNATVGPSEARRAKEDASVDSAEDKEGYHGCKPVEASFGCCLPVGIKAIYPKRDLALPRRLCAVMR